MTTANKTPSAKLDEARKILGTSYLSDDWEKTGTNLEEFFKILKALDEVTSFEKTFIRDIILCSPARSDETGVVLKVHETEPHGKRLARTKFTNIGLDKLFGEFVKDRSCILWQGGTSPIRLCREKGLRELMNSLGLSGSAIDKQSPCRDNYLAELISVAPEKRQVTLISRTEGTDVDKFEKVFSIRTEKYNSVPLAAMEDVYTAICDADMGEIKCVGWTVNHDIATVDIEFPSATADFKELCGLKDDIEAGVRLTTSGTGYSSFMAKETWRIHNTVSEHSTVKQKHIGKWDANDFVKNVKENIFDEYCKLPERLCELFDIVLVNDEFVKNNSIKTAEAVLLNCTKSVFKHINLAAAFKSKLDEEKASRSSYVTKLAELLVECFSVEMQKVIAEGCRFEITAYDLAIAIMALPERAKGIPQSYLENFANSCGKAAYAEYKEGSNYIAKLPEISIVA